MANNDQRLDPMFTIFCASEQGEFEGELLVSLHFLQIRQIQKDLGLTKGQIIKINEVIAKTNEMVMKPYIEQGFQKESFESLAKKLDQTRKRLADILRPPQLLRVKGIMLQMYGFWSLSPKDLLEVIRVNPDQKVIIGNIRTQMFRNIKEMSDKPIKTNLNNICIYTVMSLDKYKNIINNNELAVINILSNEQKDAIDKLKGNSLILID
jgi:hypothetical protein